MVNQVQVSIIGNQYIFLSIVNQLYCSTEKHKVDEGSKYSLEGPSYSLISVDPKEPLQITFNDMTSTSYGKLIYR